MVLDIHNMAGDDFAKITGTFVSHSVLSVFVGIVWTSTLVPVCLEKSV